MPLTCEKIKAIIQLYILNNNLEISTNQGQKLSFDFSAYLNEVIHFYFGDSTDFAVRMED